MKNKHIVIPVVAAFAALAFTIPATTAVIQHQETQREKACVQSGGSYVLPVRGGGRECQK